MPECVVVAAALDVVDVVVVLVVVVDGTGAPVGEAVGDTVGVFGTRLVGCTVGFGNGDRVGALAMDQYND